MMQAIVITARSVLNPAASEKVIIRRRRRLSTLAPRTGEPVICLLNGTPKWRRDWKKTCVADGDVVTFIINPPQGGGGKKNPLGMILQIGLMMVAPGLGNALANSLGLAGQSLFGVSFGRIFGGAISMLGGALINGLTSQPSTPASHVAQSLAAPSPTYNLNAQGNLARLGEAIPVLYGEHIVFPDWAADPYNEAVENEVYLYQLFLVTQGWVDHQSIHDTLKISNTPVSSFDEITYEIVDPGQPVTLFPTNVVVASEVAGQEATSGTWLGPYVVSGPAVHTNFIAVDLLLPRGLGYINDSAGVDQMTVSFVVEAQSIDDLGVPTSTWNVIGGATIARATNTPQRLSYRYPVTEARYQVRLQRTDTKSTDNRALHELDWAGLRGYVPGTQQYGDVTLIAMRMKATNGLSSSASRKVNLVPKRKLPVWNGTTWSAPTVTRSIAWAAADVLRAEYGGQVLDARYALDQLLALDATWTTRGDNFDGIFDQTLTAWEALTLVLRAGRTQPYRQGGMVYFVRDEPRSLPAAMFNMNNTVAQSLEVEYLFPGDDSADSMIIEYFSEITWKWEPIEIALPGVTPTKPPVTRRIVGIKNHAHAFREGIFTLADSYYRRQRVTLATEMEGFIASFGDLVGLGQDRCLWGQSGEVIGYDALTKTVTTSEPLDWSAPGNKYFAFRNRNGSLGVTWLATAGAQENQAVLANPLSFTPVTDGSEVGTLYIFGHAINGSADKPYQRALIKALQPRDMEHVQLNLIVEDDRVHTVDQTAAPTQNTSWPLPPFVITRPVVQSITIAQAGTPDNPVLEVSWPVAASADSYVVELSTDNTAWVNVASPISNSARIAVPVGTVRVRVAAIGSAAGPYVTSAAIVTGQIPPPGAPTLALAESFIGTRARIVWDTMPRAVSTRIEVWAAGALKRTSVTTLDEYTYNDEDVIRDGGPWRELTFKAYSIGTVAGQESSAATLIATNPQIGALTGVHVYSGYKAGFVTFDRPAATDFAGVKVHISTNSRFTPDATNLVFDGDQDLITITHDNANAELATGTVYYLRVGGYDAFGKDGINYGATEYQFTPTSSALPSNAEVLQALNAAIADTGNPNNLILTADRFAIRFSNAGMPTDVYPFIIGMVGGQSVVGIDANVIINGSVSASNITSGTLGTAQSITVGNGNMVLDGSGALTVYDGDSSIANRDYAFLSAGKLQFQRYRGGAYQLYKSVKRIEQGDALSGQTVTIPGYFDSQPKVQVSPKSLKSFDYANRAQDQSWAVRADNLRQDPAGSGIWKFDAVAELNLASSSGTNSINETSGATASNTWNSTPTALPPSTVSINVNVSVKSKRGTGVHTNEWAYRQVTWTVFTNENGGAWVNRGSKTTTIGAAIDTSISDSLAISALPGTANQQMYVAFTAADAGGSFSLGGDSYNYSTGTVANNGDTGQAYASTPNGVTKEVTDTAANGSVAKLTMASYTPPAGWEVYQVQYTYEWSFRGIGGYGVPVSGYWGLVCGTVKNQISTGQYTLSTTDSGLANSQGLWSTPDSGFTEQYVTRQDLVVGAYNPNYVTLTAHAQGGQFGGGPVIVNARNASAVVYLRQLLANSTTPDNNFTEANFSWSVAGSTALSTGSMNWLAVGD